MGYYNNDRDASFSDLIGKTIVSITGLANGDGEAIFRTACGRTYRMWHEQSCCESVTIEDVVGDVQDLIGTPILKAEESTNQENPKADEYADDSHTWTYYKLATIKGYVDIRWYGSSNGYYSESVDFTEIVDID